MTIEEMKKQKRTLGYSYDQISRLSGVPLPTVQKVLGGITKSPRRDTIAALERVLSPSASATQENGRDSRGTGTGWMKATSGDVPLPGLCEPRASYGSFQYGNAAEMLPEYSDAYPLLPSKRQGEYTAEDRDQLPEDVRTELIFGVIFDMASPRLIHQTIVGGLFYSLYSQAASCGKDCTVFTAPADVYLYGDNKTVVQPDVFIACGLPLSLTKGGHYLGAPAFAAEVLSPSTRRKDLFLKSFAYGNAGVKEYWIVDPKRKEVTVQLFGEDPENDSKQADYTFEDTIPVSISDGHCSVDFSVILETLKRLGFE